MKHTYPLASVYRDVAHMVKSGNVANDQTSIRCAINDQLDSWSKDGWTVNHDYNQDRAIQTVRRLAANL